MSGQAESIYTAADNSVVEICRGDAGAALINFSDKEQKAKVKTTLADGQYTDVVNGAHFTVKNGILEGRLSPLTSYILYSI